MADFAPNVTPRYKLHYNAVGRTHTVMVRAPRGTDAINTTAIGLNLLSAVFTALAPIMFDDLAFLSAEYALTDSDLFFPTDIPAPVAGAIGIALASGQDSITHLTFSGRGAFGSKVNTKIYGVVLNPDLLPANPQSDFVLLASEAAQVAGAIAALNNTLSNHVTVDNSHPVYAARATIKVNDFWLRRLRQGL